MPKKFIGTLALAVGIMLGSIVGAFASRPVTVQVNRLCMEDEVIVGRGDYVGGKGWTRYKCEALDDLTEGGR